MQTLIEKIGKYNICVQNLLNHIDEYEQKVKREIPSELWPDFSLHLLAQAEAVNKIQ